MATPKTIDSSLKQFMMDVICTGDGDVPLFLRIGDGNESDRAIFAQLMKQFQQEWNLDSIYVADSALYSAENIQQLGELNWITLVPRSIKTAKILAESIANEILVESEIPGYHIASCCSDYGGVRQRLLIIESEKRRDRDLKQLDKRLTKQLKAAKSELKSLMKQEFACPKGYRDRRESFRAPHMLPMPNKLRSNWSEAGNIIP